MTPSDRPMAFVTGANKGIGFEVAPAIAKADYVVLLGARNPPSRRSWVALRPFYFRTSGERSIRAFHSSR
jgi:NAD(P)-dependent dehydrogenase (short-subunit alcohol dehydrogenase family)